MAENHLHQFNQSCKSCSTSIPQGLTEHGRISELFSHDVVIILSTICSLASFAGTFGNTLVLLAVRNNQNLRTIPDLFITSLAVSDLTVCALYLPIMIHHDLGHHDLSAEHILYDSTKRFLGQIFMVASATNIFAVTVDRVIAIRFPFKYIVVMTARNALVGIVVVWFVAFVFGIAYSGKFISQQYVAFYSLAMLLTTIIMYIYIFIVAKRQENRIQNVNLATERAAAEKKVAKTVFTVAGVYALCWGPVFLLPFFINPSSNPILFRRVFRPAQILVTCNSALNPYIYCMRSQKYRTAFGKMLRIQRCIDGQ